MEVFLTLHTYFLYTENAGVGIVHTCTLMMRVKTEPWHASKSLQYIHTEREREIISSFQQYIYIEILRNTAAVAVVADLERTYKNMCIVYT